MLQNILVQCIITYVSILIVNGDGCPQSIPTKTIVASCPRDTTELIKARERKQCYLISQNCTTADSFEYHCLPNKYINMFVELCASKTFIVGQNCAYYDIESNSIRPNLHQPCRNHTNPCPAVYVSSSTFKYQKCYEDKRSEKTNERATLIPVLIEKNDENHEYLLYIICIVAVVVPMIVLLIQIVCLRRCLIHFKRFLNKIQKRTKRRREEDEDAESVDFFFDDILMPAENIEVTGVTYKSDYYS